MIAYRDTRGPGRSGLKALLEEASGSEPKDLRDYAILRLAHDCALRRGEIAELDLEHADLAANRLSIKGKGRADREWITLPESTKRAMKRRSQHRGSDAGPLS